MYVAYKYVCTGSGDVLWLKRADRDGAGMDRKPMHLWVNSLSGFGFIMFCLRLWSNDWVMVDIFRSSIYWIMEILNENDLNVVKIIWDVKVRFDRANVCYIQRNIVLIFTVHIRDENANEINKFCLAAKWEFWYFCDVWRKCMHIHKILCLWNFPLWRKFSPNIFQSIFFASQVRKIKIKLLFYKVFTLIHETLRNAVSFVYISIWSKYT